MILSRVAPNILVVLAWMCLALVGCTNPAQRVDGNANGTLSLSMPALVSGTGATALPKSRVSRVYGPYTSVDVEVLDSAGQSLTTSTFTSDDWDKVLQLPSGTGYQVNLKVYHSSTSATVPTVVGTATGVSVTAGQTTAVTITCVPYAALEATGEDSVALTAEGSQAFYKVNVEQGKTYRADVDEANEDDDYYGVVGFGLFDESGRAIRKWSTDMSTDWTSSYTGVAYIGLYNRSVDPMSLRLSTNEIQLQLDTAVEPLEIEYFDYGSFKLGKTAPEYTTIKVAQTGTYQFNLDTDASYLVKVYENDDYTGSPTVYQADSGQVALDLVGSQTYYVTLETTLDYNLLTEGTFARLLPTSGGSYVDGTLTEDLTLGLYVVNVEPGASYTINWADSQDQPNGEDYSADVLVQGYQDDLDSDHSYFPRTDSGHTVGRTFTAAAGQTRMYLGVFVDGGITADCTYGIKVTKN